MCSGALVFGVAALPSALRRAPAITAVAGLVLAIFFGFKPVYALASGDQNLSMLFLRPHGGNGEGMSFRVIDPSSSLTEKDREALEAAGLSGTFEVSGSFGANRVRWPRAKALVVFKDMLEADFSLPQPKHCTIVYVQDGREFGRVPPDAPVLSRAIRFQREAQGWHLTVENANGSRSGGSFTP